MRPLRLQVENLACFRGRHEALDLSAFELFAIAGPTGAGKSSLLDAIVFALYGRVPRIGAGVSELVALGRDRLAVSLDFKCSGRTYRVARALHRDRKGKASEAALEELVGGEERPLEDGVSAVNKALERIIGVGYDAFTQSVILPQGEFQRFLKSRPADRRAILSDLLRLQVYKRMYDRASEEEKRLAAFLQGQQAVIEGESEVATPELIAQAQGRLELTEREIATLRAAIGQHEKCLLLLRVRRHKTLELEDAERRQEELRTSERQSAEAERRLAAASKAELLQPRLEASQNAKDQLRSLSQRWERERRAEAEATLDNEAARRELKAAEKGAGKIPQLAARLRDLDAVSGLRGPLEAARKRLAETREKHERTDRELEAARGAEREARARAKAAEKAQRSAAERLLASGYDAEKQARLEVHRNSALLLGQLRTAAAQAASDERDAAALAERLANAERKQAQALATAEKAGRKAVAALAEAEAVQREAERAHAAMHLRASLASGQECPVCEQPVARVPKATRAPALEAGQARLDAARQEEAAARAEQQARRDALAEATAAHRQAKQRAEQAASARAKAADGLQEAERALLSATSRDLDARQKGAVEARLRAALERMATARTAHDAASAEHERALRERERAEQALAAALETGAAAARVLEDHGQAAEAAEREARELKARIDAVAGGADPESERARLEQEREGVAEALQQAQRRERDAADALLQVRLQREQAQHAMSEAQRALGEAGTALELALAEAGFKSAEAAKAAALDAASRRQLQEALDAFRAESHALETRVAELRRETGAARVGAEELSSAESALADQRSRLEEGAGDAARLAERIADLERRAARAKELSQSLQRERRRQAVYQQLATDLRSENFRAFVLEEAFHELVAGASERLFALSGRYTFEFQDDAFHVLDHDNARERRSAETLSGGETFLASLALALELSQQIQRAAGAVHLDSLFIDEGFGTLDPETLDTIAGTLEELPVGGRMVGIITHLPELTERIPNRVRVERRPEGSRFSVERQ